MWQRPSANYRLPGDEVHVWRMILKTPDVCATQWQKTLSQDERDRADRFKFELDRKRYVVGRGALRLLLARILDVPVEQLRFEYAASGKPALAAGHRLPLNFNVSHSGDLILVAVAIGRALGIDVERIRTDLATERIAAQYFSTVECEVLASLAVHARREAFFACWTRKEAYVKARGDGLLLPLDQFDVAFRPGEVPRLLATRDDPAEAMRWTLRDLQPGRDYAAALAVEGSGWKLKCWDWTAALADRA